MFFGKYFSSADFGDFFWIYVVSAEKTDDLIGKDVSPLRGVFHGVLALSMFYLLRKKSGASTHIPLSTEPSILGKFEF